MLGTIGFGELLMTVVGIGGTLFWIWALADCIQHETSPQQRLMWAVIIALGHVIGGLAYFFIRRPRRRASRP
ncbi:MAG: PLD nuclease N-terminal domain-containing protein [Thermoanaerobaculaceae bacterium]|nr:PLD nuclease N-terminal domain-containing protein [Thermoanaerobaculaceae bacterium]